MKKLLFVFSAAAFLTACNNTADTAGAKKDSLDSIANAKKDMIDSAAQQKKDQVDSTTSAKKDVVEKMDSLNKKDSTKK